MSKILTIIPARLASARLPNKPLADIEGKTMIVRVYEQAKKANLGEVIVACDSKEIADVITNVGGRVIITDPNLPSGTDRIFSALSQIENNQQFDVIVNLQGDLPVIDPQVIYSAAILALNSDADIATVASIITNEDEINNPNVVKIAIAFMENKNPMRRFVADVNPKFDQELNYKMGTALYFSRSAIPYGAQEYYHHIGIYAYKRTALEKFVKLKPSDLEKRESLEQLRALENNMKIVVGIVDSHPLSVDTALDLEKVKKFLQNNEGKKQEG